MTDAEKNYYFETLGNLQLIKPSIDIQIEKMPRGYRVDLISNVLAKNVFVYHPDVVNFNDNYFDLIPGKKKTIHCDGDINLDLEGGLKWESLFEALYE